MAEYIEKNEFFDAIRAEFYDIMPTGSEVISRLLKFPAADVRENVKATWENVEITQTDVCLGNLPTAITSMFCPVCKRYHNEVYFYGNPIEMARFCPRCGAQMGGAEDG